MCEGNTLLVMVVELQKIRMGHLIVMQPAVKRVAPTNLIGNVLVMKTGLLHAKVFLQI